MHVCVGVCDKRPGDPGPPPTVGRGLQGTLCSGGSGCARKVKGDSRPGLALGVLPTPAHLSPHTAQPSPTPARTEGREEGPLAQLSSWQHPASQADRCTDLPIPKSSTWEGLFLHGLFCPSPAGPLWSPGVCQALRGPPLHTSGSGPRPLADRHPPQSLRGLQPGGSCTPCLAHHHSGPCGAWEGSAASPTPGRTEAAQMEGAGGSSGGPPGLLQPGAQRWEIQTAGGCGVGGSLWCLVRRTSAAEPKSLLPSSLATEAARANPSPALPSCLAGGGGCRGRGRVWGGEGLPGRPPGD